MRSSLYQVFGSYDVFGKAIPGAVLMFGLVSFFQKSDLPGVFNQRLSNFAVILILVLLAGLMIGQAVHTLAVNIEKGFQWTARRPKRLFGLIRAWRNWDLRIERLRKSGNYTNQRLSVRYMFNGWNNTVEWIRRRYWGVYDSLAGHRELFSKSIEWNFQPPTSSGRWKEGERGELYELFVESFETVYDIDIRKLSPSEIKKQYPLITAKLENSTQGNFRHFQAIYSFCRSMWVVFLILFAGYFDLVYTKILFGNFIVESEPVLFTVLSSTAEALLPFVLLLTAGLFFDAAGTYKRHYVEYLIAAFATSQEISEDSDSSLTLDDF